MRKPGETSEIGFCQNLVMDGTVQLGEAATEWVDTAVSEILKRISSWALISWERALGLAGARLLFVNVSVWRRDFIGVCLSEDFIH